MKLYSEETLRKELLKALPKSKDEKSADCYMAAKAAIDLFMENLPEADEEYPTSLTVVYTCPRCNNTLHPIILPSYPPKSLYECFACGWKSDYTSSSLIKVPYPDNNSKAAAN